jgi:predicted NAD/FAD-binding protein
VKIAVIGAGIAGNVVAAELHRDHEVTVFEAGDHVGGHAHTQRVQHEGREHVVDTGFIVYNERTYPAFTRLLSDLGVATQPSSMSFSVRCESTGMEYNGTTINSLFAQRSNIFRPAFHRMWRDILRFNRHAPQAVEHGSSDLTLGDYVREHHYSPQFVNHYLLPMAAAIWSATPVDVETMPARFLIGFFRNHGMLNVNDRPQWRTVTGGSNRYVEKLVAPFRSRIHLRTPVESVRRLASHVQIKVRGVEMRRFDRVFFACHSDQALLLLGGDASPAERAVLGAMRYQSNEVVLHGDASLLPRRRLAWAAWNYHLPRDPVDRVCVTYNMNILQGLQSKSPLCVTLNRGAAIAPGKVLRRLSYDHPVFTTQAVAAQARHRELNGARHSYYCGAYWRNGFHEDGVVSAQQALRHWREDLRDAQCALPRVG